MSHADTSAFRLSTVILRSAALFIGRCFPSSLTLSISLLPVYRLWRHTRVPVPLEQGKPLLSLASTVMLLTIVRGTVNALGNKKSQLQLSPVVVPINARETDSCVTGFYSLTTTSTSANLQARGVRCQSLGVRNVHKNHATAVKSIIRMPINIPPTKIVNILVNII